MNRRFASLAVALLLASGAGGVCARSDAAPQPSQGGVPEGVVVPSWSQLTPAQQETLAPLRERWDQLPASRRALALERMERRARWEALSPDQRERLRHGARNYRNLPPELRQKMRASMHAVHRLPEDERRALKQRWRAMDPEQRREWLDAGGPGLAPPPDG